MTKSAYFTTADRVYSYQTCIRQTLPGGLAIGNVTWYSFTTNRHQGTCKVLECDVTLDNVPLGTSDLLPLAYKRGLIAYNPKPVTDASGMYYVEHYTLSSRLSPA